MAVPPTSSGSVTVSSASRDLDSTRLKVTPAPSGSVVRPGVRGTSSAVGLGRPSSSATTTEADDGSPTL